jgi:hypothetical protein
VSSVELVIVAKTIANEVDEDMPAEAIISELMTLLQRFLAETPESDLCVLEQRAVDFGRRAAELAMEQMLSAQEDEPSEMECECGGKAYAKDRRSRVQVTLAGTHSIRGARYHCPSCGAWSYPRNEKLGIGAGNYSAGVVALTSEVAAGFPFGPCEEFLARRFGLDLCYKQVQRVAEKTGGLMAKHEKAQATLAVSPDCAVVSAESPEILTISADGLMVHSDGSWQEMKVGTILGERGRSSIATMSRCEEFGNLLYLEALRRGVGNAKRVVFVADGAVWIWNLVAKHFPDATEVVDWYHAVGHLWEVANSWYGESTDKAKKWVKRNKARLAQDGVERVVSSIRQWNPATQEQETLKRENLHYFTTNAQRMLYATFELNGFYIGSGSVESACKQYGQGRLKQAGMRWKSEGIEAIAHLRSALLNRRTDNILEVARIAA